MKNKKTPNQTSSIYLRDIEKHLKPQFKAACAQRGKSMKDVLVAMMKEYIKNGQTQP